MHYDAYHQKLRRMFSSNIIKEMTDHDRKETHGTKTAILSTVLCN